MYQKQLKIAISAVKKSEKTFRKYFGTKTQVEMKNGDHRDLVSYADKKIEKDIRAYLLPHFPDYGYIGEEEGESKPTAEYHWVIDPIDGTTNYLHGLTDCAISLGLLKNGKPVLGVIMVPLAQKLYTSNKGGGAKLNGKKIMVSNVTEPKKAFGSFGWGRDIGYAVNNFPRLLPKVGKIRVIGSAVVTLGHIAEGIADFYVSKGVKIWDYAACQILIEEAGGTLLPPHGDKPMFAGNKKLVKKLLRLVK